MKMTPEDMNRLKLAMDLLENPGLAAKLIHVIGVPFEKAFDYLPEKWMDTVQTITRKSLHHALDVAVKTIDPREKKTTSSDALHRLLAAASGGIGGAFGLPALAIELPVTTVVMFRSIADIARSEGENLRLIEARLACLEVFALGGSSEKDNAAENGYYAVRAVLARQISEAAEYLVKGGAVREGSPALVRFIAAIASRFEITVSQKTAASAVPVIGAAGGALINTVFINHFQNMARGHFIIRSLERKYGEEYVKIGYEKMG
jgi:hypothetical protein